MPQRTLFALPRTPRHPLDALGVVLGSVDAVRNVRALYVLLATFAAAGLPSAFARSALASGQGLVAALAAAVGLFVAFYGGNAAGILVMDDARGVAVREPREALRAALGSAHRLLLALLAIAALLAAAGAVLVALLWLSRPDVSGPHLGAWLFGALVPLGVLAAGIALLAGVAVVVPLAAPGVWAGTDAARLLRQLGRWSRLRLLKVALLMTAVSLVTAGVGAVASFVVVSGGRVMALLATTVVGVDLPPALLMSGAAAPGAASAAAATAHVSAALVGEGVVFALALVLPGLVYLRGTCAVYLAMCEDSPDP